MTAIAVRMGAARTLVPVSDISVERSLEDVTGRMSCTTFLRDRGSLGEPIDVDIDGKRRLTGVVEAYPGNVERGYAITGRSRPVALQVTQAIGTEIFRSTTLRAVVATLAARVGIQVGEVPDDRVGRFKLRRGQDLHAAIQELAHAHGAVVTDDAQGRVRLYRVPDQIAAFETWEHGRGDVLEITDSPSISEWRDEIIVRGWRYPVASDVAAPVAGQIATEIVAGNIRPSRLVMASKRANSRGRAGLQAATEAAKRLGDSFPVTVRLRRTEREPGDLVRIKRPPAINRVFVVQSLTWTISASQSDVVAQCVLPEAYGLTSAVDTDLIQAVKR